MPLAEFAVEGESGGRVIVDVDSQSADGIVKVSRGGEAHLEVKPVWKKLGSE